MYELIMQDLVGPSFTWHKIMHKPPHELYMYWFVCYILYIATKMLQNMVLVMLVLIHEFTS